MDRPPTTAAAKCFNALLSLGEAGWWSTAGTMNNMPGSRSDEFTHDICFFLSLTPFLRIDQIMTTWIAFLFHKSPLDPFTALASGITALSIRLNAIRGLCLCYVDGRNGLGGESIGSGEGAQGEATDTKADFVFLVADGFGRVLRVRRLYFLIPPMLCLCTFAKSKYWEAFVSSCSFQPANQPFAGNHIICAPRFPLPIRDPGALFSATS